MFHETCLSRSVTALVFRHTCRVGVLAHRCVYCSAANGGRVRPPYKLARPHSGSLSPVLRGEGWGEGPFSRGAHFPERPLTLTLSPEYRGEGTRKIARTRTRSFGNPSMIAAEVPWHGRPAHGIFFSVPDQMPSLNPIGNTFVMMRSFYSMSENITSMFISFEPARNRKI